MQNPSGVRQSVYHEMLAGEREETNRCIGGNAICGGFIHQRPVRNGVWHQKARVGQCVADVGDRMGEQESMAGCQCKAIQGAARQDVLFGFDILDLDHIHDAAEHVVMTGTITDRPCAVAAQDQRCGAEQCDKTNAEYKRGQGP